MHYRVAPLFLGFVRPGKADQLPAGSARRAVMIRTGWASI